GGGRRLGGRGPGGGAAAPAARVQRGADAGTARCSHGDARTRRRRPGRTARTGKTVIACALIAERKQPTLILAQSKPLLEQWRSQLESLLGLPSAKIGQLGGCRRKRTRVIDLIMIQSLKTIDDLEALFSDYGLLVVDECHHLPAVSFEAAVRRAPVRHFLGLTATPYRRDGLQEILTMQCGPIRHRAARSEPPAGEIPPQLAVRQTALLSPLPTRRSTRSSGCSLKTSSGPLSSATTCSPRSPRASAVSSSASGSNTVSCSPTPSAAAASRRSYSRAAWQTRPCRHPPADREHTHRRGPRRHRHRPVPRGRFRLPPTRRAFPRLPPLLQGTTHPVHRAAHAQQQHKGQRASLRLRGHERSRAARHARATPQDVQVAWIHPAA